MRNFLLVICLISFFSCQKESFNKPFFLGKWHVKNKNVSDGIYEVWQDSISGKRYNLQGLDTLYSNKLYFETNNDSTFFVIGSQKELPKKYYVSQKTDTNFTAENPNIIFPSKFIYSIRKEKLHVEIVDKYQENNFTYIFNKITEE